MQKLCTSLILTATLLAGFGCGSDKKNKRSPHEETGLNLTSQDNKIKGRFNWTEGPKARDYNNKARVVLDQALKSKAKLVAVKPWMRVHNHGTDTSKLDFKENSEGQWDISGLYFSMSGEWEITLVFEIEGDEDEVLIKFDVP